MQAATNLMFSEIGRREPTGLTSRSCSTRSSLACWASGSELISSMKKVPLLALSSRPDLPPLLALVKAPSA
ncbi:hypothetical protein D3C85_1694210 [compost metagenome]